MPDTRRYTCKHLQYELLYITSAVTTIDSSLELHQSSTHENDLHTTLTDFPHHHKCYLVAERDFRSVNERVGGSLLLVGERCLRQLHSPRWLNIRVVECNMKWAETSKSHCRCFLVETRIGRYTPLCWLSTSSQVSQDTKLICKLQVEFVFVSYKLFDN